MGKRSEAIPQGKITPSRRPFPALSQLSTAGPFSLIKILAHIPELRGMGASLYQEALLAAPGFLSWEGLHLTATMNNPLNLGFLTVLQEASGFLGGYLVTNQWGRPLEFRLSTAVQPNKVHKILYAHTLQPYICADLIGKTLVEKTGTPVQMVVTDTQACLDLRLKLEIPVAWIARSQGIENIGPVLASPSADDSLPDTVLIRDTLHCHAVFPQDGPVIDELLDRLIGLDLSEPFARIREAIAEARKMGVSRAA